MDAQRLEERAGAEWAKDTKRYGSPLYAEGKGSQLLWQLIVPVPGHCDPTALHLSNVASDHRPPGDN